MNIRNVSSTLVLVAGLGVAGFQVQSSALARGPEAAAPPDALEAVKGKETDYVQAWVDLVERYQPIAGKDVTAPNAHDSLVQIFALVEGVNQRVWKSVHGTAPDFETVYSTREGEVAGDEASRQRAAALVMLEELDRSQFDALFAELVGRARAVVPPIDSPKRVAELEAMGITEAEPVGSRLLGATLPEMSKVRNVTRIHLARMHQAAAAGDWDRLIRCFEQILAMARVVSHQPSPLDRLTATAVASVAMIHVRWHITEGRPNDAILEAIAAAMERQLHFPSMEFYSEGEKLMVLDMLSLTFKQRGLKLILPVDGEQPDEKGKPPEPRKPGKATVQQSLETINEYYTLTIKEVALARSERAPLAADRRTFEQERIVQRVPLLQPFIKSVDMMMNAADQFELERAGTRAFIAVERSHRATGVWPATLSDAAKQAQLNAMIDPWSSKMPVKYLRLDAADAHGRNYLIYSVGVDGEDDRGKELEKAKRLDALNKPLTSWADFVINVPRE